MNSVTNPIVKDDLLTQIPSSLRVELLDVYSVIEQRYREHNWEPSELNGGKFCEVVYSILAGYFAGSYPANASKPKNMVAACQAFEKEPSSHPRSLRIQIPRMLIALYEVRNNRGVGHVGGDVDPNVMDSACVLRIAKWILSELIRVFHGVSSEEATQQISMLSERDITVIWRVNGKIRVLDPKLSMLSKTLLVLYSVAGAVSERDLVDWLEHSNTSVYRRDILKKAHRERLLEYDPDTRTATLSPLGSRQAERLLAT